MNEEYWEETKEEEPEADDDILGDLGEEEPEAPGPEASEEEIAAVQLKALDDRKAIIHKRLKQPKKKKKKIHVKKPKVSTKKEIDLDPGEDEDDL